MHRWALHKNEGHHILAVVGPNVDVQPILARLSLNLQVLARGHEVVCSSGTVTIFGGLGLVLADNEVPIVAMEARHRSSTAPTASRPSLSG